MARPSVAYVCQSCGAAHPKWVGKCEACGAWNTLVEETTAPVPGSGGKALPRRGRALEFVDLGGTSPPAPRMLSGIAEFDRVAGGGLVPASAFLIGGDPGIGKSTLLLQAVARMATAGLRTAYVSGEEAVDQVRLRASRLGLAGAPVELAAATSLSEIIPALDHANGPQVVVIDSIQTMFVETLDSAPGTVAQVRSSAQELIRLAKRRGFALLLVGHVTKEGTIAGPRVLEHMVDTVMYFEGERGHQFRILRAVKNRFGPTDEIGVFEMTEGGLVEVLNPSALFLAERRGDVSGAAVFAGVEGTRPLLVEIQALVAPSALGTPRRAVVGWDTNRLAMILAVLEARCGVAIGGHDVYLNVAGGLRITEPAADLAVAAALISSLTQVPLPPDTVVFGEIGLAGEVRQVGQAEARLKEALRLGFARAIVPRGAKGGRRFWPELDVTPVDLLSGLVERLTSGKMLPPAQITGGGFFVHERLLMGFDAADIVILIIVVLSGLWAMMRGFVREVLGVAGWIGAAFATLYLYPVALPYARELITLDVGAKAATVVGVFLLALILLSFVSSAISSRVRDSGFNPLDRSLGFVYGLARGAAVICIAYLVMNLLLKPTEDPPWLASAKTLPLIKRGAEMLGGFVPQDAREKGAAATEDARRKTQKALEVERALQELTQPEPKADATRPANGYDNQERRELDRLIQGKRSSRDPRPIDDRRPSGTAR